MKRLIIALVVVAVGGGIALLWWNWKERKDKERIAILFVRESIKTPLMSFRLHVGRHPSTEEGLRALVIAPHSVANRWRGPYVAGVIPLDPWGRPYLYRSPGVRNSGGYDVWSAGADPGSDRDDLGNWEK